MFRSPPFLHGERRGKLEIIYRRSDRQSMAIEITRDLQIIVRLPRGCSDERAHRFVAEHMDWIETHYRQQQQRVTRHELSEQEIAALREKAARIIPERVAYFAKLTGLRPTKVGITAAKTRFGSCSGKNSVNFSLYLMQYSPGAVDYVVLHELCHIRYKNHSKEFYRLIARYMPDYQRYRKELRA